jgi:dolichol kinase
MNDKSLREAMRKSIHISSLAIPFFYRYVLDYNRKLMFLILLAALMVAIVVELYRLQLPTFRRVFHRLFGLILRRHEIGDFTGATFLIFSSLLCVVFFTPDVTFLAISFLSVGDTFAAIIGINFGKRKFIGTKKSLEGSIGCFVSALLFAFIFQSSLSPWVFVTGALFATLAELWEIPMDDNVKLPLISGIVMSMINVFV